MKKRMILNLCMVLTIILVAVCGVMAVGSVKGWFDDSTETSGNLTVTEKTGIAMIERNGIAYEVSEGTVVRQGDILYTKNASTLQIGDAEKSRISLDGNAEISIQAVGKALSVEVLKGDSLIDARGMTSVTAITGDTHVSVDGAVASVSTQAGSSMVFVYSGSITRTEGDAAIETEAGQVITIAANSDEADITSLSANSLSDAQMTKLIKCGMDETFCFTEADLNKVRSDREAEKLKAQQALLAQKEADNQARAEAERQAEEAKKSEKSKKQENSQKDTTSSESVATGGTSIESNTEDNTQPPASEEQPAPEPEPVIPEDTSLYCTIEIRCDTILDNMGNLTEGKEGYVPESGTILGTSAVAFTEGETVFDVLQRVCDSTGIQLEYSWTPMYDSYYIEGINHLYEFDCGSESGWMYKVNGWFPNYGCSSYDLQDGDTIVWCYTCNGLGADVGGSNF